MLDKVKNIEFVNLLTSNYHRIYNFILSMVPNRTEADDIMQEASIVMMEKFEELSSSEEFLPWAFTVAKFQVLKYLKKKGDRAVLNEKLIRMLSEQSRKRSENLDDWIDALQECVGKLPNLDRELVDMKYNQQCTANEIAGHTGLPAPKVYRRIYKIHELLQRCVRFVMGESK
ncbi:RNA polymerase sigma factor SigV [Sedimentisphaera cyanobacteriorum]|uniref:RNA polymerase sigma factor SigV n=1 Tax=Sedimentisphaera cyanobacteriorum TaxID=1940790 RepID=A0A1Q2HP14_9BACT|nr:sigma-70 family RNA polymerase sigma factor [Sedimentisphaera cyanobacteriorum]AQQ09202.1 RNA polymerase sigma factor SigV [Sedimentisphaera cyanobacteriorum]